MYANAFTGMKMVTFSQTGERIWPEKKLDLLIPLAPCEASTHTLSPLSSVKIASPSANICLFRETVSDCICTTLFFIKVTTAKLDVPLHEN